MKKILFGSCLLLTCSLLILSCGDNEPKEDMVNAVNKKGSVETSVTVKEADSTHDVVVTKHIVWNHDTTYKTIEYYDTIPSLGNENKKVEDKNGNIQTVNARKEYEIFITVK